MRICCFIHFFTTCFLFSSLIIAYQSAMRHGIFITHSNTRIFAHRFLIAPSLLNKMLFLLSNKRAKIELAYCVTMLYTMYSLTRML